MSTVCTSGGGRLIKATNVQNAAPLSVLLDGDTIPLNLGVVSAIQVSAQVAAQFMNTFDGGLFVTPFGDTPGDAAITFIMNRRADCDGTGEVPLGTAPAYYLANRIRPGTAPRRATIVSIGPYAFYGFTVGLRISAQAGDLPMTTATLMMKVWP